MSEPKKCSAHYVDPEIGYCVNCITRWLEQRNKLLDYVKWLSEITSKKVIHSNQVHRESRTVLKEIGEL